MKTCIPCGHSCDSGETCAKCGEASWLRIEEPELAPEAPPAEPEKPRRGRK